MKAVARRIHFKDADGLQTAPTGAELLDGLGLSQKQLST